IEQDVLERHAAQVEARSRLVRSRGPLEIKPAFAAHRTARRGRLGGGRAARAREAAGGRIAVNKRGLAGRAPEERGGGQTGQNRVLHFHVCPFVFSSLIFI